jgi:peptide/nickel transport system permease protein
MNVKLKTTNLKSVIVRTLIIITQNKLTLIGLLIVFSVTLMAIFAPQMSPYNYKAVDINNMLSAPNRSHLFGTDQFGRDILSRVIMGSRVSLVVGLGSALLSAVIGIFIGALSGWVGGIVDTIFMRIMDVILAFPSIILAIALSSIIYPNIPSLIGIIAIHRIPQFARQTRGAVLSVKQIEYVESARSIGQKSNQILVKHVLPNCLTSIIVYFTFSVATAINTEAALSFLGIGIQPPEASWGILLNDAKNYVLLAPWIAIFPGIVITSAILAFNLIGDGIRDVLDPKIKGNLR